MVNFRPKLLNGPLEMCVHQFNSFGSKLVLGGFRWFTEFLYPWSLVTGKKIIHNAQITVHFVKITERIYGRDKTPFEPVSMLYAL